MLNNSQNNADNKSTLHKIMVNTFQFLKMGLNYCGQGNLCVNLEDGKPVSKTIKRRFRSHFGPTPALCVYLWDRIDKVSLPAGTCLKNIDLSPTGEEWVEGHITHTAGLQFQKPAVDCTKGQTPTR
jgi:hypothetical protein